MSHPLWISLIKNGISPNQLYFLDCCRNKIKPTGIINEQAERMICRHKKLIDDNNRLNLTALQILEEFENLLVATKKKVAKQLLGADFMDRVKEYREIFPVGKLPSGELARQTPQELKDKFIWFFKTYPEYDWNLVLDAADFYIHTKSLTAFQYTTSSSYFIKKSEARGKEIMSKLADYCQMILDDPSLKR